MANEYQIMLKNSSGDTIACLENYLELDATRTVNQIGVLKLTVPYNYFPDSFWDVDNQIEIWRSVNNAPLYLEGETAYLVRFARKTLDSRGIWGLEVTAVDTIDILNRHIVAYDDKTAQANQTDQADDMCRAIVKQNLGSTATDTARSLAAYISVGVDLSACPSISKSFAHRNVLTTLKEIAEASYTQGTYLAYDIVSTVPLTGCAFEFRTYSSQRGIDHRWGYGDSPVVLDPEAGNLIEVERGIDYRKLSNYVYGKGVTASDTTSIGLSPFNRCESWASGGNAKTTAEFQTEADDLLRKSRVKRTFSARAVDTTYVQYGKTYGFGDFITCSFMGEKIDTRIEAVNINIREYKETVSILLKADA